MLIFFGALLCMMLAVVFVIKEFDRNFMPTAVTMANLRAKTLINNAVNKSLSRIIAENSLKSEDFYTVKHDVTGVISSMSVNTILVNEICNKAALLISEELNNLSSEVIVIPAGSVMGYGVFSNVGPNVTFGILPMGSAVVDYRSGFESTGINQINFQVYLHVEATARVVNPLQRDEISITRDIPLVNTFISEPIPDSYFNVPGIKD